MGKLGGATRSSSARATRGIGYLVLLVSSAMGAVACGGSETETLTTVILEPDARIREQMARLSLKVWNTEGVLETFGSSDPAVIRRATRLDLTPEPGTDPATRRWLVEAEYFGDDDTLLGVARATGGYVAGARREVRLCTTLSCFGVACDGTGCSSSSSDAGSPDGDSADAGPPGACTSCDEGVCARIEDEVLHLPGGAPTCPMDCFASEPGAERTCDNAVDDDCDGLFNCEDDDCDGRTCGAGLVCRRDAVTDGECVCDPTGTEDCTNGIDDDCNGLTDCADRAVCPMGTACGIGELACNAAGLCECSTGALPSAEVCADGVDNDCDGDTDCADSDCEGRACQDGAPAALCTSGVCRCAAGVPSVELCHDMLDNDCDTALDCGDPECVRGRETNCTDTRDDDCDGLRNCEDTADCNNANIAEICGNGLDDDCDDHTDCEDRECCGVDPMCNGRQIEGLTHTACCGGVMTNLADNDDHCGACGMDCQNEFPCLRVPGLTQERYHCGCDRGVGPAPRCPSGQQCLERNGRERCQCESIDDCRTPGTSNSRCNRNPDDNHNYCEF